MGTCPTLLHGGIHGNNEAKVYAEMCEAVEEALNLYRKDRKPVPKPTNKAYSGELVLRVGKELHQVIAVRAMQAEKSLNSYCQDFLKSAVIRRI